MQQTRGDGECVAWQRGVVGTGSMRGLSSYFRGEVWQRAAMESGKPEERTRGLRQDKKSNELHDKSRIIGAQIG